MSEFRIDTHTHSHYSADGVSHPLAMIEAARRVGLSGFVLTDHDSHRGVDFLRREGWVREDGKAVDDFLVIPGQEVSTREGHVLVIGILFPPQPGISCYELLKAVHEMGGLCIAAHPFDPARRGVGRRVLEAAGFDAIEVCNAASWFPGLNGRANSFARRHAAVATAGSDAHHPDAMGRAHQIFDLPELSVAAVLTALGAGQSRPCFGLLRPRDYIIKSWNNLVRPPMPDESGEASSAFSSL